MYYFGADHYYFWLGVKAAVFRICDDSDLGPNFVSKIQNKCLESYMDGFTIGLNMTLKEYKELIK